MKDNPLVIIIVLLGLIAGIIFAPRAFVDGLAEKIPFALNTTPQSTPTLSAGGAGVEATRVAQEQSAQMTAVVAQGEMQATAAAGVVDATRHAAEAEGASRAQAATAQAASTMGAIQATANHKRFAATATSAAEITRAAATAVAATATRQVEENRMTATVESRQAGVAAAAAEKERRAAEWESARVLLAFGAEEWKGMLALGLPLAALVLATILLLPSTMRTLLEIWDKYTRRKECKTKVTPS